VYLLIYASALFALCKMAYLLHDRDSQLSNREVLWARQSSLHQRCVRDPPQSQGSLLRSQSHPPLRSHLLPNTSLFSHSSRGGGSHWPGWVSCTKFNNSPFKYYIVLNSPRTTGGMGGDFCPTTYRRPWHYNSSTCVIPTLKGVCALKTYIISMPFPPFTYLLIRALVLNQLFV